MNNIACFYINLADRTDRDQYIRNELCFFEDVTRVDATRHNNGAYGLALSALRALDLAEAQNKDNICIFEDDFQWEINVSDVKKQLIAILAQNFDIVMLSYHIPVVKLYDLNPPLARVENGQTTCGYMFKKHMISDLRRVFTISRDNLLKGRPDQFAIDQTWKVLQNTHKSYAAIPRMGRQRPGYSDIEKKLVSYDGGCFMIILSCEKYKSRRESQDLKRCPLPYRYFIGRPDLLVAKEEGDIVYLPCGDHYENLPQKTYGALHWVHNNYPHLDYVFKTDDDVEFNFTKLYMLLSMLMLRKVDYAGNCIKCEGHKSIYHYGKCDNKTVEQPVYLEKAIFCSGGAYFLSKRSIEICVDSRKDYDNSVIEDHTTGLVLNRRGVYPLHVMGLTPNICKW
jgi:hypothetical protein